MSNEIESKNTVNIYEIEYTKSTYEKLFGKKNSYIIWVIFSIVMTTTGFLFIYFWGKKVDRYIIGIFAMVTEISLWPIIYSYLSKNFHKIFRNSIVYLFWKPNDFDKATMWYKNKYRMTFNVFSRKPIILTTILIAFGILTIAALIPKVFLDEYENLITIVGYIPILIVGIPSVVSVIGIFSILVELSKREPMHLLTGIGYKYYRDLKNYYEILTWILVVINIIIFLGFYFTPFEGGESLPSILRIWLFFISVWPTLFLIIVNYLFNTIETNMKQLIVAGSIKIEDIKKSSLAELDLIANIQKIMEFEKYVQEYHPSNTRLTVVFTIIPIIVSVLQLLLIFLNK